jgi:hypothetical protein
MTDVILNHWALRVNLGAIHSLKVLFAVYFRIDKVTNYTPRNGRALLVLSYTFENDDFLLCFIHSQGAAQPLN